MRKIKPFIKEQIKNGHFKDAIISITILSMFVSGVIAAIIVVFEV